MDEVAATVLFPFGGNASFGKLAVESMVKHSIYPLGLLVAVEPMATDADKEWVRSLETSWPGPVRLLFNEKRGGYYGTCNRLVEECPSEVAILFTNDQVAAPGWDAELLKYLAPNRFVTGRLVESGATLIADRTIWKNFGKVPEDFDEAAFIAFCASFVPPVPLDLPRHYIPMAFHVDDFKRSGMFVAGKDTMNVSTYREDLYFFLRCLEQGIELVEVQKPNSYHFQSGSKRKTALLRGLLNYIYPFGLRPLHKRLTGYVALIDALEEAGGREQLERVLASLEKDSKV